MLDQMFSQSTVLIVFVLLKGGNPKESSIGTKNAIAIAYQVRCRGSILFLAIATIMKTPPIMKHVVPMSNVTGERP